MSALDTALKSATASRNCEIYFYLKKYGFLSPIFKNLEEVELSEDQLKLFYDFESNQRAKVIKEACSGRQKLINLLCSKSFIHNRKTSSDLEIEYRKKIIMWFEDIFKIESCVDMLNAAATSEKLKIIFDFENIKVSLV